MAKWADYLISGVWFSGTDSSRHISHVMLHEDLGETVGLGHKKTKDHVVALINANRTVFTIKWGYPKWNKGAKVGVEQRSGVHYLRSYPDATITDNLDNMLPMDMFNF